MPVSARKITQEAVVRTTMVLVVIAYVRLVQVQMKINASNVSRTQKRLMVPASVHRTMKGILVKSSEVTAMFYVSVAVGLLPETVSLALKTLRKSTEFVHVKQTILVKDVKNMVVHVQFYARLVLDQMMQIV